MTATLNASTSSGVILTSDTSGSLAVQSNGTTVGTFSSAGFTYTTPSTAQPAFSAYQSTLQSVTLTTWTKIQFQTEEFDTAGCFDNVTNYRFTPTVAGYYQVEGAVTFGGASNMGSAIYKNGTEYKRGFFSSNANAAAMSLVSALVYLNGTTDYIEFYGYSGATQNTVATAYQTYFQGVLVRTA